MHLRRTVVETHFMGIFQDVIRRHADDLPTPHASMVQHEGNMLLEQGLSEHLQVQILGEGVRGSLLVRPNDVGDDDPWMPVAVRVRSYAQSIQNPGKFNYGSVRFWNDNNVTAALMGRCPLILVNLHNNLVWYVPTKEIGNARLKKVLNF